MAEVAHMTLRGEFRTFDPGSARIVLLEAGPRILSAFSEAQARYAKTSLEKMGVEVITGTAVTGCDAQGVDTAGGRIETTCIIWAAGVTASPAAEWLGVGHDKSGKILVRPDLSVPDHPDIFAIGDTAAVPWENGQLVPGLASAAKQMGRYVGQVIAARISRQTPPPPFHYRHEGNLATVGRNAAIVSIGRFELTGLLGWLFWGLVHIYFLINTRNRIAIAFKWVWDFVTFQRSVRLIVPGRE
jgi:NADH dehydrogenase